jgi:predicted 3-demethylubiquinone-9 3-methyltransferase (glyoxalase superfamily)
MYSRIEPVQGIIIKQGASIEEKKRVNMKVNQPDNIPAINTHFWFNENAIVAANFYVSVFPHSKVLHTSTMHPNTSYQLEIVQFELSGQKYSAMGSANNFQLNESMSLVIHCKSQQEIDYYWNTLGEKGIEQSCGWLKDQYGISWQIIPSHLGQLLAANPNKQSHIMQCFLGMKKISIQALQTAAQ